MTKFDTDQTDIALIKNDISYIKGDLGEIKTGIKGLPGIFASKEQLVQVAREVETRLQALEKSTGLAKYLSPIVSGVLCSFITFLLLQYIQQGV